MNENFSSLKAASDALEASLNTKQNKVTGVCAVGSSIREIKADGTVTCEATTGTGGASYTAGAGLTLAANQFSVDASKVQSRVSGVCAANSAIKEVKPDGQVICEAVGSTGGGVAGVSSVNGKTAGVTLESGSTNLTIDNSQTGKVVFNVENSNYTAGTGLALAGGVFSIDATKTQSRVSGTCAAGSFLTGVNQDGTVNCATGGSSYTAGAGLLLTGTAFSADTTLLQSRVSGTCAAGQFLTGVNQDGTVNCATVAGGANPAAFVYVPGVGSEDPFFSEVNNPLINGDPNALLFVTPIGILDGAIIKIQYHPNRGSIGLPPSLERWYIACKEIKPKSYFNCPTSYNILVIKR